MTEALRERRKRMTREPVVSAALRRFAEHAYAGTTCEQSADAADVSPATFYRYSPGKEGVVLRDVYDPVLAAVIDSRPPGRADEGGEPADAIARSPTALREMVCDPGGRR